EESLRRLFPGLELLRHQMEGIDDLERDIALRYAARVPQLGRVDGRTLTAPLTVLQALVRRFARAPTPRPPLDLQGTHAYAEPRTLRVPPGFRVSNLPAGGEVESPFGRLSLEVEQSGPVVRAETRFEVRTDRVSTAQYPAFRRF